MASSMDAVQAPFHVVHLSVRGRAARFMAIQLAVLVWTIPLLFLSNAGSASAQGLIAVPPTVTRELGAYYISKLGLAEGGMQFYGIIAQRNVGSTNAYALINDISPTDSPQRAAAKSSSVRGVYSKNSLGGKVTVESFYRLLRCEEDTCFIVSRVTPAEVNGGSNGTFYPLALVKTTMGSTSWQINAPQGAVNTLLDTANERPYTDPVYTSFTLYYKAPRPLPCSSALPQTQAGAISEIATVPGYACMAYKNISLIVGTDEGDMISLMKKDPLPWSQCDGSLLLVYVLAYDTGPSIFRVVRNGGDVPFTVQVDLPPNTQTCNFLYHTPDNTVQAAQAILQYPITTTGDVSGIPGVTRLFNYSGQQCAPTYSYATYGAFGTGQNEALTDGVTDPNYLAAFLPYNRDPSQVCISMLSEVMPPASGRDAREDQCAQLYFGNSTQLTEGLITYWNYRPSTSATIALTKKPNLESNCGGSRYSLSVQLVLPQIAVDFEAEKNFLLSSAEVKFHLDGVAASAASMLAIEAAIATSGIVVARIIARTGLYRQRRVRSSHARASAMLTAAVVITIFNVPNFALIDRSLSNHDTPASYTQVSLHNYRPSNYSTVLRAETHTFVTVQGSRATAIIGLMFYVATMLLCLYLTWVEFTEIIHRREAAESRLGQDALLADKDLLVQWRAADSLVYDTLHPKKVVESAQAHELEIMRLNLAHAAAANAGGTVPPSPGVRPPSTGGSPLRLRPPLPKTPAGDRGAKQDVPDLYQEV